MAYLERPTANLESDSDLLVSIYVRIEGALALCVLMTLTTAVELQEVELLAITGGILVAGVIVTHLRIRREALLSFADIHR